MQTMYLQGSRNPDNRAMSSSQRASPVDSRPSPSPSFPEPSPVESISPITFSDMSSSHRNLADVPEEGGRRGSGISPVPASPYLLSSPAASTSTFTVNNTGGSRVARKPASVRTLGKSSSDQLSVAGTAGSTASSSVRRATSTSSTTPQQSAVTSGSANRTPRSTTTAPQISASAPVQKYRTNPRLPHDKEVEPAPSTIMYWSRAPVWGAIPTRSMRAHTVTVVDTTAWLIGGCDDKESSKDIYCFNTETMQWTHLDTVGDHPPASRAHTATLHDRKIIVCGGGLGSTYYDSVYVFDTTMRRWSKPHIAPGPSPAPRRAHSGVCYRGKVWIFGGGNGLTALNDVWTLDVGGGAGAAAKAMRWEEVQTSGLKPGARGYHTANLVGNVMVIIGGSDSKECFTDVWCLNLDTLEWTSNIKPGQQIYKRLAHTATQVGSYIFVVGGHTSSEYVSELLLYDLVSLQYEPRPRLILGKPPSPRGYHEAVLSDSRLFLFGGFNGYTAFDDVYILDLAAGAYLPQVTSFTMGSA